MPAVMNQSKQAVGGRLFAQMIMRWRDRQGWSFRKTEAISALASGGEAKVTNGYLAKASAVARGDLAGWSPRADIFEGMAEVSEFLELYNTGKLKPQLPFRYEKGNTKEVVTEADLMNKFVIRDADGNILKAEDLFAIYVGNKQDPTYLCINHEVCQAIAPGFGKTLEQAMNQSDLSPIRDISKLLKKFQGDKEKLRQVLYDEAVYTAEELDAALPMIAYALSTASGKQWAVDDLVTLAQGGNGSSIN